jgi:hypothetical protein
LIVGPLRVEMPSATDRTAYDGIVDGFGQFRLGTWPEKINSTEILRARGAEEAAQLAQWRAAAPERDRYGGLLGKGGFRATGFFRTERRDGRWWLATPEGNPFFSIGLNCVAPWGATYIEGREFMFRDLPAPDGELAGHWSEQDDRRGWGAQRGRSFDHGRAFDFHTANIEGKFGANWPERWREEALAPLEAWSFNTIGNWSDSDLWAMHRLPYTVPLSPEGDYAKVGSSLNWWGPMPDAFDTRFAEAVDKMAQNAASRFRGDPYLIGYFVDNEMSWGEDYTYQAARPLSVGPRRLSGRTAESGQVGFCFVSDRDLSQARTPCAELGDTGDVLGCTARHRVRATGGIPQKLFYYPSLKCF